jgi:hypothetical protein
MSTLSLDDVPSPDNVLSPISTHFLDDVPSPVSSLYLDNVPPHISAHSLDDALSPISTHSLDDVPSPILTPLDNVPSHLSTFPPHHPIDNSTHSLDNVASPTLTVSLDSVPSPFLAHSLDDMWTQVSVTQSGHFAKLVLHDERCAHAVRYQSSSAQVGDISSM